MLNECPVPGASVAKVVREHGLYANVVHAWRKQQREREGQTGQLPASDVTTPAQFVAVPLPVLPMAAPADIRIEPRRGTAAVSIVWPVQAAGDCAAWAARSG